MDMIMINDDFSPKIDPDCWFVQKRGMHWSTKATQRLDRLTWPWRPFRVQRWLDAWRCERPCPASTSQDAGSVRQRKINSSTNTAAEVVVPTSWPLCEPTPPSQPCDEVAHRAAATRPQISHSTTFRWIPAEIGLPCSARRPMAQTMGIDLMRTFVYDQIPNMLPIVIKHVVLKVSRGW